MLSLVQEDYCLSDLQEGLLCLKQVKYNQDKLKGCNALVEGVTGFVREQMESRASQASAVMHPRFQRTPWNSRR